MSKSNTPRDIIIDTSAADKFAAITSESDSPFNGMDRKDVFVLSAAIGHDQGLRTTIESRHALAQLASLSNEQRWVLKSISAKEHGDVDILDDKPRVYKIAGEYATGGIDYLNNLRTSPEDMYSRLSTDIIKVANLYMDDD